MTRTRSLARRRQPLPPAAALTRLKLGGLIVSALVAIVFCVAGVWLMSEARHQTEAWKTTRPELLELAYRFAGIAAWAIGQVVIVQGVVRVVYRPAWSDRILGLAASLIFLVSALAAVACGMTGVIAG